MNFSCLNGGFLPFDKCRLTTANRAFRYGDAIFESIRVINGNIVFFNEHFARISEGIKKLNFKCEKILIDKKLLHSTLNKLLKLNKIEQGGRLRLQIFRSDGGLYTPLSNIAEFIAEVEPFKPNGYEIGSISKVGIYKEVRLNFSSISHLKTTNSLPYILASIYKQKNNFNEVILLDSKNNLSECTASNLFWIKNEIIYTPSLSTGCIAGVFRKFILNSCKKLHFPIYEVEETEETLKNAQTVFTTNVMQGIKFVKKINGVRYEKHSMLIKLISVCL